MKNYTFNAAEFAKLELLLGRAHHLFHQKRSKAEFERFQVEFYPILRDVYYEAFWTKIDDDQPEAISASDPRPLGPRTIPLIGQSKSPLEIFETQDFTLRHYIGFWPSEKFTTTSFASMLAHDAGDGRRRHRQACEIADIVALIEAKEAEKPDCRGGPYKKREETSCPMSNKTLHPRSLAA